MILVDGLVIAVGIVYLLSWPQARQPRTMMVLIVLALLLLGANALPDPLATFIVKAAVVVTYLTLVTLFPHRLVGRSRDEAAFEESLRKLTEPVQASHSEWGRAEAAVESGLARAARARTHERAQAALQAVSDLVAPDPKWTRVQRLEIAYLTQLSARSSDPGFAGTDDEVSALVRELGEAWDDARRTTGGFVADGSR